MEIKAFACGYCCLTDWLGMVFIPTSGGALNQRPGGMQLISP